MVWCFIQITTAEKGKKIDSIRKLQSTWWRELKKQIRVEGFIEKASKEDSDDYFAYFHHLLKSLNLASFLNQSSKISSYEDLKNQIDEYLEQNDQSSIKRPDQVYILSFQMQLSFYKSEITIRNS